MFVAGVASLNNVGSYYSSLRFLILLHSDCLRKRNCKRGLQRGRNYEHVVIVRASLCQFCCALAPVKWTSVLTLLKLRTRFLAQIYQPLLLRASLILEKVSEKYISSTFSFPVQVICRSSSSEVLSLHGQGLKNTLISLPEVGVTKNTFLRKAEGRRKWEGRNWDGWTMQRMI
jgi:hypothetical protein